MQFTLRELIAAMVASGSLMGVCMLSYVHREAELIQISQFEIKLKTRDDEHEKYVSALKKRMNSEDIEAAQKECGRYSDNVFIGYQGGTIVGNQGVK